MSVLRRLTFAIFSGFGQLRGFYISRLRGLGLAPSHEGSGDSLSCCEPFITADGRLRVGGEREKNKNTFCESL